MLLLIPPPAYLLLPFAGLLLAIALMPLAAVRHWEHRHPWWAAGLGTVCVGYYLFVRGDAGSVLHAAHEYVSFMVLIGSLFVVAGGVHLSVKSEARPWTNVLFLVIGAFIANFIGTTGASMLLIRPWIRMNQGRITGYHVAFFIFIVSNIGGGLTPIGDPPLFLGFLKGVPFWWTLQHCWQPWVVAMLAMLGIFYVLDVRNFRKTPQCEAAHETWRVNGLHNLFFLAIILGSVFIKNPPFLREGIMVVAALASWMTTRQEIHQANDFTMAPVKEVAWLFLGIFATMIPALQYLQAHAAILGLQSEWQYYWNCGILSTILDNAPTFLAFLATAFGMAGLELPSGMSDFLASHSGTLAALSVSSVFFGAMTYIGNGPNLMVRAIAHRTKVETPGFLSYIFRYAIPFLLPVLFLVGILFFR